MENLESSIINEKCAEDQLKKSQKGLFGEFQFVGMISLKFAGFARKNVAMRLAEGIR